MGFDFVWKLVLRDTDIAEHLLILYALATGSNAKTIVEIGAGQSTYVLLQAAEQNKGEFYSIDLTPDSSAKRLFSDAPDISNETRYRPIKGDSLNIKWDKEIDFLFIDSGHTYDLTLGELKKYTRFVREGGFICMHDTGEYNNIFSDCRRAMIDFTKDLGWEYKQLNNQNGMTILRKI
ncbi:MAG: hypothetical protein C5B43_04175 [Verrucomicrobia bacterium]|nr:MAG: hypothetical protein C5B43_04175 [Verrucomicrobiota bacterium]